MSIDQEEDVPRMPDALIGLYRSHCFWAWCKHTEADINPEAAARHMQAHYDAEHRNDLTKLGYPPREGNRNA